MKVLVVAAHPDDEVLGCGGTIPRLAREGDQVYLAILGEGITSRYDKRNDADHSQLKALHNCCRRAAETLGVRDLFFHDLPDNRFDTVPLLDIVKIIEELIGSLSPEVVYTHHGGDLNIDHRLAQQAVLTAARPTKGQPVRKIYSFEAPSSTEWAFQRIEPAFRPNLFVDISATLPVKLKALTCYESEIRAFPHPRSRAAVQATALRWGSVAGLEAAEAFELIREVR